MRMLVVDDDVTVLWLRERLEPRGFEVRGTPSGDDALYLWESERPWDMVVDHAGEEDQERVRTGESNTLRERIAKDSDLHERSGPLGNPGASDAQALQDRAPAADPAAARAAAGVRYKDEK